MAARPTPTPIPACAPVERPDDVGVLYESVLLSELGSSVLEGEDVDSAVVGSSVAVSVGVWEGSACLFLSRGWLYEVARSFSHRPKQKGHGGKPSDKATHI